MRTQQDRDQFYEDLKKAREAQAEKHRQRYYLQKAQEILGKPLATEENKATT